MVTLLVPRVGEVDEHLFEAAWRQLVAQQFHGVVARYAHVGQAQRFYAQQQVAHAGLVHFGAQVVAVGVQRRQRRQLLPIAKTNLERHRCRAAE